MRLFAFALIFLVMYAGTGSSCEVARGPFLKSLDAWGKSCGHPLCGRIYAADPARVRKQAAPCDEETWLTLKEEIQEAVHKGGAVLLGEVHDNPEHHEIRARMGMANYASVVFEQLRDDQKDGIETFAARHVDGFRDGESGVEDFKQTIKWDQSGWAKYDYAPLLKAAILSRRPIYPGDPTRELISKAAKEGPTGVPSEDLVRFKLDVPLGAALDKAANTEIQEAHCGGLLEAALSTMAFAQRYRDAHLANAVITAIDKHGSAVLISGNTHVRTDRGVPWYIHQRTPERKVVSLMFVEVETGKDDPAAYVPRDPEGKPATDYIIFTPRAEHRDACAQPSEKLQ